MTRTVRPLLTALAVVLLLASPVLAQQAGKSDRADQPRAGFEGRVEVSEVLLDVLVTDKDGRVIVGLQPKDFVVEENGKPVDITDVTFYSNSVLQENQEHMATPSAAKLDVDRIPVDRYFILFFHDQRLETTRIVQANRQQLEAARKARRWVREEMLPTDWVAVVSYDVKLNVHQDFTHDKAALLRALEDAPISKDRKGGNWPSRIEETDRPALRPYLPEGKRLSRKTRNIYEGLEVLARAAGHIPARKNLLFFSRGFGEINDFGIYEPDPRYYYDMVETLNENNIAVYAIDTTPPEVSHTLENALNSVANDTGGKYYFNFTNFITPLRQVADENTGYYLLAYKATHPAGESGYQKVQVKTTNPSFKVRAREGYLYGEEG
jgi:VWFA-related protein